MYKILLVDDDVAFRAQMNSRIDWEAAGFTIIAEARNGREAIEQIPASSPDIIITDISMSVMNGVELINYVSEFHREIQVIALSAYNDFDYVRASLKSGAVDYLLKNQLDDGCLLEALKIATEKLSAKGVRESAMPVVNREKSIQELIILLLSHYAANREEMKERLKGLGLGILAQGFMTAVMEPDNEKLKEELDQDEYYKLLYSMKSIMQESAHSGDGAFVTVIGRNRIIILIARQGQSVYQAQDRARKILASMRDNVSRFLNEDISFGVSKSCADVIDLPAFYEEAVEVLETERFLGKTRFIAEAGGELKDKKVVALDVETEREIYASILGKSERKLDAIIRDVFDGFMESGCSSEDIQMALAEMLNIVTRQLRDRSIPEEEAFAEGDLSSQKLRQSCTLPELKERFTRIYGQLDRLCRAQRLSSQYSENTKRSIKYIELNYREKISLGDIANAVGVNSSYLSRLFKSDTGINIIDCLNKIRIEKSVQLINEGKCPLKDIAEEVGIQNYNYFFKLFKKYCGVTPGEYRQQ
jgi:two-component system, response regulator YesN